MKHKFNWTPQSIYPEMAQPKPSVSLKLLIDTDAKKVLFAEASKDCVDFLFNIMSLPVATIIALLKKQGMVGSLGNLYESIENLNDSYVQPNQSKDALLKPYTPSSVPLLLTNDAPTGAKFFACHHCRNSAYSDGRRAVCPGCNSTMTRSLYTYVDPPAAQQGQGGNEGGFVKGVVTYMVMDNLVVKPMSTISSITLLNKFKIKDVALLEEKVVYLGMPQAIALLKASLMSDKVLTTVFFMGK